MTMKNNTSNNSNNISITFNNNDNKFNRVNSNSKYIKILDLEWSKNMTGKTTLMKTRKNKKAEI